MIVPRASLRPSPRVVARLPRPDSAAASPTPSSRRSTLRRFAPRGRTQDTALATPADRTHTPRTAPRHDASPAFAAYLDKVRRHAYKTTDEDVAALKDAGYSEDEIFEHTVSAAVAAGLERLDAGLRVLP